MIRRGAAALAASACIVGAPLCAGSLAPVAAAHDVVLHSTPADGSTVASFPEKIVLEFSAIPKDQFNTIAVTNADTKKVLFTAKPVRKQQYMTVDVPSNVHPGPGDYTVGYQITSSDGHATRGSVSFKVKGSGSGTASTTPSTATPSKANASAKSNEATSDSATQSLPLGTLIAILAVVVVIVGVFVMIRKRK